MSMHMLPAMYSTTGKKKGKQKFRNAEAANTARRNAEAWQELLGKYDVKATMEGSNVGGKGNSKSMGTYSTDWRSRVDPRRLTDNIPSVDTGVAVASKPPDKVYTGDAMIGIGQLHKSNGIPVFSRQDAHDLAIMRRG